MRRGWAGAIVAGCGLLGVAGTASAQPQPVPEHERIPVDVRRTTLVVRDVDRSLALYRDALGLKVVYDQRIGGDAGVRLVLLRANDAFIGALGLMQRLSAEERAQAAARPIVHERARAGQAILVLNARDLETRWDKVKSVPGVKVSAGPHRVEYPAPDGGPGTIPVTVTMFWDPDGYFVELNQILGTPAGSQPSPEAGATVSSRRSSRPARPIAPRGRTR
jgi:catechol 2,3-dioxygenase-like lactoylglutathione lyase family enzyme